MTCFRLMKVSAAYKLLRGLLHGLMASHINGRRHSSSRVSSVRDAEVDLRGFRRRRTSDEKDRRRSKGHAPEIVETVYVRRHVDGARRREDPKEHRLRRSTDNVARHKIEAERRRHEEVDLTRKDSKRRYSHHQEEDGKMRRRTERRGSSASMHHDRSFRRSSSLREKSAPRPPLVRSQTSVHRTRPSSDNIFTPLIPSTSKEVERTPFHRKPDRPSSILGSFFNSPKPPPRPPPPRKPPPPEKQVECLTCLSDVPASRAAKLACQHYMCRSCLRRIFTLSITDPQHMPPKCCTADHIPLKHVEHLFDLKFKKTWNRKYQEYTTKNRIYCPSRGCGEWIKPAHIHIDTSGGASGGRKYGNCKRCRTKVCCTCNGRWHAGRECPKDEATARFAEIAKQEGWQRCFNCSATVELKEGCNHMTCRCNAEFCMICGAKWKTCDCPWFNYETVENDRLNHARFAEDPPVLRGILRHPQRNPALRYQEEMELRRDQERADEALARRILVLDLDEEPAMPPTPPLPPTRVPTHPRHGVPVDINAYLVHPPPHLAPEFLRRAQDILAQAWTPQQEWRANTLLRPQAPQHPQPPQAQNHPPAPPPPQPQNHPPPQPQNQRPPPPRVQPPPAFQHPSRAHNNNQNQTPAPPQRQQMEGRVRDSLLAGLERGTMEGRVDAWRRRVEV
ncbi:MAG: hypothetical protein Q9195_003977 [Heterodermia aff. obscurata]